MREEKNMKKNRKKLFSGWKNVQWGIILFVLFAAFAVFGAGEIKAPGATVRLADPENEEKLAADRERLAKQEAELAKLKTENIQKQTENARKTAELNRLNAENTALKNEKKRLEQQKAVLEDEVSVRKAEAERLRTDGTKAKSDLQTDMAMLEEQNQNLRRELLDTLERCTRLSSRLKQLEMSAAGLIETLNPVYSGQREIELAESLELTMRCGLKLADRSSEVADLLLPKLERLKLEAVEEARLRVALDELTSQARLFARLSVPPGKPEDFRKCRILELDDTLEVAVLSAGHRNGVRVNMNLKVSKTDQTLRVIAVRPFVSAAVLEKGDFRKLSPGMELQASGGNEK